MKKTAIVLGIFFLFLGGNVYASEQTELETRTDKVKAAATGLPALPAGYDEKGFVGEILARIFDASGKIRAIFIDAFEDVYYMSGNQNNIVKWSGSGFALGTMYDVGGKVGIGTNSPSQKLDVEGNIFLNGSLVQSLDRGIIGNMEYVTTPSAGFKYLTNNIGGFIKLTTTRDDSGNIVPSEKQGMSFNVFPSGTTGTIVSGSSGNFLFLQASTGNVGIGTSSPIEKLDVSGDVRIRGASSGTGKIYLGTADQSLFGNNSAKLTLQSNHTSSSQLEFVDKNGVNYGRVYGGGVGSQFGLLDGDGNWSYLTVKDEYTQFRVNNSAIMTLSGGNVGIGTSSPLYPIHIKSNTTYNQVVLENTVANSKFLKLGVGDFAATIQYKDALHISSNTTTGNDAGVRTMSIIGQDVGIGSMTPTQRLDVNGKIRMRTQTDSGDTADTVATKGYVDSKIGSGTGGSATWRSWKNVTGSRTTDTIYTNTYGGGLMVNVQRHTVDGFNAIEVSEDGLTWVEVNRSWRGNPFSAIIPPGHKYKVTGSNNIWIWSELKMGNIGGAGTGGSGGGATFVCTNEQSDGDGTGDNADCVAATSVIGTNKLNPGYVFEGCYEGIMFTSRGVRWESNKWTVDKSGPRTDCVDGTAVIQKVGTSTSDIETTIQNWWKDCYYRDLVGPGWDGDFYCKKTANTMQTLCCRAK